MKTNLTLLLLLVMMVSCQPKKSDSTEMSVAEAAKIDNIEDCTVDTVKATAIFWIDKAETKHCKEYGIRQKTIPGCRDVHTPSSFQISSVGKDV